MNKELIYKVFFDTISNSLEWSFELKDTYADWIDGVVAMTQNLINSLDNQTNQNECSCPAEKIYSYSGEKL